MIRQTSFERRYTYGQHVARHGRLISAPGQATPWRNDCVFEKGVIIMLPGKSREPYTVLDEQTFIVVEPQGEHLAPLS